jgi:hypothetical protein
MRINLTNPHFSNPLLCRLELFRALHFKTNNQLYCHLIIKPRFCIRLKINGKKVPIRSRYTLKVQSETSATKIALYGVLNKVEKSIYPSQPRYDLKTSRKLIPHKHLSGNPLLVSNTFHQLSCPKAWLVKSKLLMVPKSIWPNTVRIKKLYPSRPKYDVTRIKETYYEST